MTRRGGRWGWGPLGRGVADQALNKKKYKCCAGVCKACGSRDTSAGKLARFQQQFAQDLEPSSPGAPQTLGDMTERLKVGAGITKCAPNSLLSRLLCS